MDYVWMYVIFALMFIFGGTAYWVVTRIFSEDSRTYEPQAEEQGTA